jgi:hypothetical protein
VSSARRDSPEYFSALTGRGIGADDFSWTAALTIDLITRPSPGSERDTNERNVQ